MSETKKEIWLNENFTASSVKKLRDDIIEYSESNPNKPIIVYINSYGGSVDSLNLIIDTFNQVPNEIITCCMGTVMSAGAVLLSCGDKRFVSQHSRVMIHEVSAGAFGTASEIQNQTDEIHRMNVTLLSLLSKNTGKSVKHLRALLKKTPDLYFTAKNAVAFGLADYIGIPSIIETQQYHIIVDNKKLLTNSKKSKKLLKRRTNG